MKNVQHEAVSLANDGCSIGEIAAELGISYEAARHRLLRHGTKATPERSRDYRHAVMDMKASDAVEYLLETLDYITGAPKVAEHDEIQDECPTLSPKERRLLAHLAYREGWYCPADALMQAMYFDCIDSAPDSKIIPVYICKIRKKLREAGSKWTITNRHMQGWKLNKGPVQ